jgi:hypothetical protein
MNEDIALKLGILYSTRKGLSSVLPSKMEYSAFIDIAFLCVDFEHSIPFVLLNP